MRAKNIFRFIAVVALTINVSVILTAQQGRGKGRVKGTGVDEEGNPIEGVRITAQHLKFNTTFEGESGKNGNWAVAGLGTGYFRFTATMDGYETTYYEINVSQFSQNNPAIDFILMKIDISPLSDMPAIENEATVALFDEGNLLFEEEKYAEAAAKFEEFLELNPTIVQVNLNIGNCYRQMKEYERPLQPTKLFLIKHSSKENRIKEHQNPLQILSNKAWICLDWLTCKLHMRSFCIPYALIIFRQS